MAQKRTKSAPRRGGRSGNNGNRPRPQPVARTRNRVAGPRVEALPRSLLSLLDPFSKDAATAKYPSVGSTNSISEGYRGLIAIESDAAGRAFLGFGPALISDVSHYATAVWSAGTWNMSGTAYPGRSHTMLQTVLAVTAGGAKGRVNSYGVRLFSTASMTDASGTLMIGIASDRVTTMAALPAFAPRTFTQFEAHPWSHGCEYAVVANPCSDSAHDYGIADTTSADELPNYESIVLQWQGLPASKTVGYVEVYSNYEFTVGNHALARIAAPSAVANFHHATALDGVRNAAKRITKGGVEQVARHYEGKLAHWAAGKLRGAAAHPGRTAGHLLENAILVD
jgi:hypothetical protein